MKQIYVLFIVFLVACGGGDSDIGLAADQQLTVDYVERELHLENYTTSGTALIYENASQDTYHFNRVIISKVSNALDGETLAYAYSLVHPSVMDNTRFVAFYIDIDNDPGTGEFIEGIGADRLLVDSTIFESMSFFSEYFIWSDAQSQWSDQSTNGLSLSVISEERTGTLSIKVPYYMNIDDLFGLAGAKGVFTVRTFSNGDPNDVNADTLGATAGFTVNTLM